MENRELRLIVPLLLLLGGCGASRASECNLLTGRINAGVARVEAFEKERLQRPEGGHAQTAQSMRQAATLYREISEEIRGLELTRKELKTLAEDYIFEVRSAGGAADTLATALEAGRQEQAMTADQLYSKHLAQQKKVIEKINGLCSR
jgi:hypothetical protein